MVVNGAAHSDQLLIASPLISKVMLESMKGLRVSTEKIEVPFDFEAAQARVQMYEPDKLA